MRVSRAVGALGNTEHMCVFPEPFGRFGSGAPGAGGAKPGRFPRCAASVHTLYGSSVYGFRKRIPGVILVITGRDMGMYRHDMTAEFSSSGHALSVRPPLQWGKVRVVLTWTSWPPRP